MLRCGVGRVWCSVDGGVATAALRETGRCPSFFVVDDFIFYVGFFSRRCLDPMICSDVLSVLSVLVLLLALLSSSLFAEVAAVPLFLCIFGECA